MPVSFTALGTTLDVTIVDNNLITWQDILRSGLQSADVLGRFSRYRIRRYTSGRITSVEYFANPYRQEAEADTAGLIDRFDLTYRSGTELAGAVANCASRIEGTYRHAYEMELLGRPGPSFHYSFQEDVYGTVLATVSGKAGFPAVWPPTRYPRDLCFSRLLTVPGCSERIYVPEPCIARITSNAKGSTNMWGHLQNATTKSDPAQFSRHNTRFHHHVRVALVVDTNPNLFSDEFVNSNTNIIDPETGITATHKSWRVLSDITRNSAQREVFQLRDEVALKGGRYYNFSMKYSDSMTHGYVDGASWSNKIWEWQDQLSANAPSISAVFGDVGNPTDGTNHPQCPLWISLWESGAIGVEFIYGRDQEKVSSMLDAEFVSVAS